MSDANSANPELAASAASAGEAMESSGPASARSHLVLNPAEKKAGWRIEQINGTTVKILRDPFLQRILSGG